MRFWMTTAAVAALGMGSLAGTAHAQSQQTAIEGRVDRLEREMKAVQRKVFPGGAGTYVEPEITPPQQPDAAPGIPASNPVVDLTQRVTALEGQLTTLTGQTEQQGYRLRQLEDAFNAYKRSTDARLKALEDGATAVGGRAPAVTPDAPATEVASAPERPAPRPGPKPAPAAATPAAESPAPKPVGTRAQQLAAIEKPSSGDPAEDGYLYGYRLWSAKLYPEARKALQEVVDKYPTHRRTSYAQNLLGRAYLDAGAPSLAAVAFYDNYKKNPNGERAPDSLYYLAQALLKLNKPKADVCKVYTELNQLYGDRMSAEIKAKAEAGVAQAKCTAQ